jgi:hypothetical protein
MEPTKNEVAAAGVSNQQSLVKRIVQSARVKSTKTIIPGGKFLLDEVDQNKLQAAVFTWLRRHRWFEWVKISFAADPDALDVVVTKVADFPEANGYAVWEQPAQGKRWLSEQISDALLRSKLIYIEARKDGLYVAKERKETDFSPQSDNWQPYYEIMPVRRGEYAINQ